MLAQTAAGQAVPARTVSAQTSATRSVATHATPVEVVGGGCTVPTGGTPGVPEAEARRPAVGARTVELAFTCPLDSNTAFILVGRCLDGPEFPDFAITPCGAGCGQRVDPNGILIEGRQLAGQFREATIEIPVPPISSLAGTDLCFQFLCFHTVGDVSHCREISQTLRLTLY